MKMILFYNKFDVSHLFNTIITINENNNTAIK